MAVTPIPTTPSYQSAVPEFIDNDVTLIPPGGGVTQTLQRLGSRWALNVSIAPSLEGVSFLAIQVALLLGRRNGASYPWPQPRVFIGAPGAPVVNGGGQTGSTLAIRGGAAGYSFAVGQFVSVTQGARRHLHQVTGAVTLSGSGVGTLAIWPMLRAIPVDGAAVEVAAPVIEGKLTDNLSWEHDRDSWVALKFRIAEVA